MKLCWLTDIHLNFPTSNVLLKFYDTVKKTDSDAILITGDIAEALSVQPHLKEMVDYVKKPIYFILGNHDFYFSEITVVRKKMPAFCKKNPLLRWLPDHDFFTLTKETILLGQDGLADGRYGNYQDSPVMLNDSRHIYEYASSAIIGKNALLDTMQSFADKEAAALTKQLNAAAESNPKQIIVLTHAPPFKEACWHDGKIGNDDWLPFFTTKALGDVILAFAKQHSTIQFLVLCGHTHSDGIYEPLENLTVKTGKAEYYCPEIQETILIR